MKLAFWILPFFLLVQRLVADDTGLYELSNDFRPVNPIQKKIECVTLISFSNDNKHYRLTLYRTESFSLPSSKMGIVVGNKVVRFFSEGSGGQGKEYSLGAMIDDTNLIPQIIQY